jgi:hypothetical protein
MVCTIIEEKLFLLEDVDDFLIEFNDSFGETNRVRMGTIKFRSLQQGSCLVSIYAVDFQQLAYDVDLDGNMLISTFWWGLQEDVKDLVLNLPDPLILTEIIIQAVRCDNQLFECR